MHELTRKEKEKKTTFFFYKNCTINEDQKMNQPKCGFNKNNEFDEQSKKF